ncbi:axotactin isoform X2 [Daktulosphaira vitifoliae]|uniref:axotactin isoform X2 n=1 Tax=Daktulosphaira vitifoliae TaxID=58002 RepID=UPI0021AAA6E2|nr:axotactin isoform X2 [Daktulosphaira vitifoliae]
MHILFFNTVLILSIIHIKGLDNSRERCGVPVVKGPCQNWIHKWYFDSILYECKIYLSGTCKSENMFDSEAECLYFCVGDHNYTNHYLGSLNQKYEFDTFTLAPIAFDDRGAELTFAESGYHTVFMMAKNNAFIQLDGNRIPTFQLRLCREISFQFRTRLPHGLLVYHSVKDRPAGLPPYALYVIVEKGQLKVVHVYGKHSTSVIVGEGLNHDIWHTVTVRIDVHGARLIAKVDNISSEKIIQGLHMGSNYGISTDLTSVVLIGGLSPEEKLHGVKYIIESFVGCIKEMVLSAGKAASDLLPIKPLIATKHDNVQEGCIDKCQTEDNICFKGSLCINHYNQLSCDCFGTLYEGEYCDIYASTVLTLRGSSYVSYRVYDWKDRVHSSMSRISFMFKTRFDDSALFYASGESHKHHHIATSIYNGSVLVEIELGDGEPIVATLGNNTNSNQWNNLTILHKDNNVDIIFNEEIISYTLAGVKNYLYIDPEIYFGGGPSLSNKPGLKSHNNFVGSLKYVFFNDISILYELKKGNPKVHYIGILSPELTEMEVDMIPITLPFPSSHIIWPVASQNHINLMFDFKSHKHMAVLVSSSVTTSVQNSSGFWELRMVNNEIRFELTPSSSKNVTQLMTVKYDLNIEGSWHKISLNYTKGLLTLNVNGNNKTTFLNGIQHFLADQTITIGSGIGGKGSFGLVGCIREIWLDGDFLEARYMVKTNRTTGQISIDNCQLVDPCKRPNACEHDGKCSVVDDEVICDCKGTGYIGKNCHFAQFRKTCEELALLGYTKPDVYLIDIDGNGKFPPGHVKCEFGAQGDSKTIVEHNLPSQIDVRSAAESDFSFTITYRDFPPEMLKELILHSLHCSQYIKYDCYKAPLDLHSATWFTSAAQDEIINFIGNAKRGSCPCSVNKTCLNRTHSCNCDFLDAKWHSDEGFYQTSKYGGLGITKMVFLQQENLQSDALGRITLGPLECVETNTQKYVVTFTTSQSYIEVPGWRKGDIAFSFRTTGEKAILLYQPPIRRQHPSFMVALTSDFKLTFNFTLNSGKSREMEVKSRRRLNNGEWQKIWIDYNSHHVRFMINTDYEMIDLLPNEKFGPFEGSMYIGGATEDLLQVTSVSQGLIGCFRGLVVNGEILDIYSYMSVHLSEIIKECKPSCAPNPCKNGAKCKELWSTFQCVCENPWAYSGIYCENNINTQGLTFITRESYFKRNYFINNITELSQESYYKLLTKNILMNLRTYDENALILHANDHLNNFVQLFILNGNSVVFVFNHRHKIYNITVKYPGLNRGKSIQLAIVRTENTTTLHVNDANSSVPVSLSLLVNYTSKPWINPELEVLSPQRPPAPPTEYFQVNIGGFDPENLISSKKELLKLAGYVGCVRGLKIDDFVVSFSSLGLASSSFNTLKEKDLRGIISGCNMKCDEQQPCKNKGICIENFEKGGSSCDCEHTSYYGDFCGLDKGADFSGLSVLRRKFLLEGPVTQVKLNLAFSSSDKRQRSTVLLLIQTENKRSYYLIVALNEKGEMIFEEDREGTGGAFGARIKDRNFLNGARHSVYYKRTESSSVLMVDRDPVELKKIPVLSLTDTLTDITAGDNEVQIGGLNTTDPRFASYTSYSGCISNVILEVNYNNMRPLDEYMLFTKTGSEKVNVTNSQGVRSAQCASFDDIHKPRPGPSLNISYGVEQTWVLDPPARMSYDSKYAKVLTQQDNTFNIIVLIMSCFLFLIIVSVSYHAYCTHVQWKKRRDEEINAEIARNKRQSIQMQEGYKINKVDDKQVNGITLEMKTLSKQPLPTLRFYAPPEENDGIKAKEFRIEPRFKHSTIRGYLNKPELTWEPIEESSEILEENFEEQTSIH